MATTIPADALGELRQKVAEWKKTPAYQKVVDARDDVLARFQPVFNSDHVPQITEEEFRPFLLDKNNRHWSGLHRQGSRMCADMGALRKALTLLLDKAQPLASRLDEATAMISGMGKNIASAILLIAYPEDYGVWNNQAEAMMRRHRIWPAFERGDSFANRYEKVNSILLVLKQELSLDLWSLDYLWWYLDPQNVGIAETTGHEEIEPVLPPEEKSFTQRFGLERHLHEFLRDNWEHTDLGREWEIFKEDGDEERGFEYPCDVGRIDLLARHREKSRWLVIELKRHQTSDQTVGQVLRYIGWVKQHLAEAGDEVQGMIICSDCDDGLRYALTTVPGVDLRLYEVNFRLKGPPPISTTRNGAKA